MPLRDPELSNDNISAPYDPPSKKDRSPEDRLSPWLFMTVSWMNPLINAGSKRQLEDDDVWELGHEFQHKGLHDKFRELKGSVVRRLLAANGVDLIILTCLALSEAVCGKACVFRMRNAIILNLGRYGHATPTAAATSIDGGSIITSKSRHCVRDHTSGGPAH